MPVSTAAKHCMYLIRPLVIGHKGKVQHEKRPGSHTVLTYYVEHALVLYLFTLLSVVFPSPNLMVKAYAWAITKRSSGDEHFNELRPNLRSGIQRSPIGSRKY